MTFYEDRKKPHTRMINGLPHHETRYLVVCDSCGKERWLKKVDARKDELCYSCTQRWKGKLGWQASQRTLRGRRQRTLGQQAYLRQHPSALELAVSLALDDLGVEYEREAMIETKAGNFYLYDFRIGSQYIEVDGTFIHSFEAKKRKDRAKKALLTRRGCPLLRIREADIKAGRTEQMLVEYLGVNYAVVG